MLEALHARDAAGSVRPRFPRARYVARTAEWEDATHPHERNRASYLQENFVPLMTAGVLDLVPDDAVMRPACGRSGPVATQCTIRSS